MSDRISLSEREIHLVNAACLYHCNARSIPREFIDNCHPIAIHRHLELWAQSANEPRTFNLESYIQLCWADWLDELTEHLIKDREEFRSETGTFKYDDQLGAIGMLIAKIYDNAITF